jgi:hypothetical protein
MAKKEVKVKKLWLWDKKTGEQFDPQQSTLTEKSVKCTLIRKIKKEFMWVEFSFYNPRTQKQVVSTMPQYMW